MNEIKPLLQGVNKIVAAGSVDGMAAVSAFLRYTGLDEEIPLIFTQAFDVGSIKVSLWPPHRKVMFIDLAVNNDAKTGGPILTLLFIRAVILGGHEIVGIADEHDKTAWANVLQECHVDINRLLIKPVDRNVDVGPNGVLKSSCGILKAFFQGADSHTINLLDAGDQADQLNCDTFFGEIFNSSVKSNMKDPDRRPYLARQLAKSPCIDQKIYGWMQEYEPIKQNSHDILSEGEHFARIGFFTCKGHYDASLIFQKAYKEADVVVLKNGKSLSIGTDRKNLDLLKVLSNTGIAASGMPSKVNLRADMWEFALPAILSALNQQFEQA